MERPTSRPSEVARPPLNAAAHNLERGSIGRGASKGAHRGKVKDSKTFVMLPHESEDIQITGGTRSLVRRLLALNLPGTLPKRPRSATDLREVRIA